MQFDWTEATRSVQAMSNGFVARLPYFIIAILVFAAFILIGRLLSNAVRALNTRNQKHYNLGLVLGRLSNGVIIFIGLLIALVIAVPGFTPGQLVNLLGLSSVAIGFAFRDILQNFLAGILILLTQPFRIGDEIIVNAFEGTVENIETRATFIRTYDGRLIVIPNSTLFTDPVTVNTATDKRRLQYDIILGQGADVAAAKELMLSTVAGIDQVLKEPPPEALVTEFAESSVKIRLRWWIEPPRQFDVYAAQDAVLARVRQALAAASSKAPDKVS